MTYELCSFSVGSKQLSTFKTAMMDEFESKFSIIKKFF